ncbi:MAG: hypothetical protein ACRD4O_13370 [Bryobacteraceae bacterium]
MAVIAPRVVAALAAALLAVALRADQTSDALAEVNRVATALSANNPAEAIAQFDQSYPDYDKLKNYFIGLTGAYTITNEATILDERDSPGVAILTLDWTLTLTQPNTSLSKQRTSKVQVRVVRKKRKWKIVSFSPIEIFNPAISSP